MCNIFGWFFIYTISIISPMIVMPHTPLNTQTIHYSVWSRAKKVERADLGGVVITTTQQLNNHHIFTKHHPHVVWQCYKSVQSLKSRSKKMGGDIVGGCIPSLLKEEKTKFFLKPRFQPLKVWNYVVGPWGVWRECLFQLAHIVLLFMPQLVIAIPQNQRGLASYQPHKHPTTFGFWWACQSLVEG